MVSALFPAADRRGPDIDHLDSRSVGGVHPRPLPHVASEGGPRGHAAALSVQFRVLPVAGRAVAHNYLRTRHIRFPRLAGHKHDAAACIDRPVHMARMVRAQGTSHIAAFKQRHAPHVAHSARPLHNPLHRPCPHPSGLHMRVLLNAEPSMQQPLRMYPPGTCDVYHRLVHY